jgi:hypothetical protein
VRTKRNTQIQALPHRKQSLFTVRTKRNTHKSSPYLTGNSRCLLWEPNGTHINPALTSQETVAVYCENQTEHTNPALTSQETVAFYCESHAECRTFICDAEVGRAKSRGSRGSCLICRQDLGTNLNHASFLVHFATARVLASGTSALCARMRWAGCVAAPTLFTLHVDDEQRKTWLCRLDYRRTEKTGFNSQREQGNLSSPQLPDRLWGSPVGISGSAFL